MCDNKKIKEKQEIEKENEQKKAQNAIEVLK